MDLDGFSALQFVPPAPKVSYGIGKMQKFFAKLFAPSFSDKSLHTMSFKVSFSMTWFSWHHIVLFSK